jgi:type II secretory pathway pseudopilin PulG
MIHMAPTRRVTRSEEGYLLVGVIFLLAIFTIALSVAVPRVAKEIQRDRELETMRRGKQYTRAVQLYYKKFHAYPPNASALVSTNKIRFLRKKYIDPTTGKDDWKPIRFGQAKTQTLGFFGQAIAGAGSAGGSVMAGIGPSGNGGFSSSSTDSSLGGSSLSGSGGSTGSGTFSTGNTGSTIGTSGTVSTSGSNSSGSSSDSGSSNQTFGGAGIIGFSPAATKTSILIYKKKQHYNEWEFVYDPLLDMKTQAGNTGAIGQPASSTSTPVGSSTFGTSSTTTPQR